MSLVGVRSDPMPGTSQSETDRIYAERLAAREQRRREVEEAAGWHMGVAGRGWSRKARKDAAIRIRNGTSQRGGDDARLKTISTKRTRALRSRQARPG